jgi:hypothetical protein
MHEKYRLHYSKIKAPVWMFRRHDWSDIVALGKFFLAEEVFFETFDFLFCGPFLERTPSFR